MICCKLKILKSYLQSIMSHERLNGLTTLCIENDMLKQIDYKNIIDEFVSQINKRNHFK